MLTGPVARVAEADGRGAMSGSISAMLAESLGVTCEIAGVAKVPRPASRARTRRAPPRVFALNVRSQVSKGSNIAGQNSVTARPEKWLQKSGRRTHSDREMG